MHSLLNELHVPMSSPPVVYCDNISTTFLCSNPVFHSQMKHVAIDFHFVRDKVAAGSLCVSHVSTKAQLADILTKPLPKQRFHLLWSKIGVFDGTTVLRGHIKDNSPQS